MKERTVKCLALEEKFKGREKIYQWQKKSYQSSGHKQRIYRQKTTSQFRDANNWSI